MKRIIIFTALLFSLASKIYSQELRTFVYNSELYYVLPDTFSAYIASSFIEHPGYISTFGLHDGKWITLSKDYPAVFPLAAGEIVNGHPEGKWFFYTIDPYDTVCYIYSHVNFKKGIAEGGFFMFDKQGKVQAYYETKDNNYHGPYKYYNHEGTVHIEGNYMYGNMSGTWKYYDSSGKLWGVSTYLSEVPRTPRSVLRAIANEEGADTTVTFPDGRTYGVVYIPYAEGPWIAYDFEGRLSLVKTFKDGRVVYVKDYYEGVLIEEGPTVNEINFGPPTRGLDPNRRHPYIKKGVWKYYDTNGNLVRTELHE
jgi:antitoxin component YwqK of YwqJK toxin-antitoxin module